MLETYSKRPTWATINLDNLAFNFRSVKAFVGDGISYMAVVKADAYGHGAIQCAKRLEKEGIDWFGVALPEEGLELRESGIKKPILCLGGFWQGQEDTIISNNLTPVIYDFTLAKALDDAAKKRNKKFKIHLKVDTGMGRIGIWHRDFEQFSNSLLGLKNLEIDGVMTHFAAADDLSQTDFTNLQMNRFNECLSILEKKGLNPSFRDTANSPAAIVHPKTRCNLVRLGGILYGLVDDVLPKEKDLPKVRPVMTLSTTIKYLKNVSKGNTLGYGRTFTTQRDSVIATIPIGYQDGYKRGLSNCGRVIINNQFAPVVGRVSMDWTIVDVTDIEDVKLGDNVILIGSSDKLTIKAEELAEKVGTISYEITCGINRRVPRIYVGSEEK